MICYYDYFRSSAAYRSGIAFNLKGLSCDFVPVHLRRDGGDQKQVAYRALNPQAPVPALEIGVLAPTRSPAIVEWPHETRPEPLLPPADRNFRARVRGRPSPTPTRRDNPTARAEPAAGRFPRSRPQL